MSRREDRDSRGKRLPSGSERERSPKRSRRDGKPATERTYSSSHNLDIDGTAEQDQKHRRRLQDALPLEAPPATSAKVKPDIPMSGSDRNADGLPGGPKLSSNPTEVPRSRSYFQHDDRGSAGQGGQSHVRRETDRRRWSDPKDQSIKDKADATDLPKKDEKTQSRAEDSNVWRHDRFSQLEVDTPPARKRPAFTEKKMPSQPESSAGATGSQSKDHNDQPVLGAGRREDRVSNHSRGMDKPERPFDQAEERDERRGDQFSGRNEMRMSGYHSRERYGTRDSRVREMYTGRYGDRSIRYSGRYGDRSIRRGDHFQEEKRKLHQKKEKEDKWKHDLFDQANRSPSPNNEEEKIAKIEALLSL